MIQFIYDHALDVLHYSKIQKFIYITKRSIFVFVILLFIDEKTAYLLWRGSGVINFGVAYGICCLLLFIDEICKIDMNVTRIRNKQETYEKEDEVYTIDGIPTHELIMFLLEYEGLPCTQFKEKFGKQNEQHKKLGDNLERIKILGRGPNNARVLRENNVDILTSIFAGVEDSDNLRPTLIEVAPGQYEFSTKTA